METTAAATNAGEQPIRRRNHPFPWLDLAVTEPYYFLHLLAFFSYFAARAVAVARDEDQSNRLIRREIQAVLVFLVLVVVKMVKEETWEGFIADSLLYAKALLVAVSLVIDRRVAMCYLLVFLVIYAITQQPPYDDIGTAGHLTPLQLESLLTEGTTSRFWLVEFRTACSSRCTRTSRVLPDLSTIYSNKNVSFGIIDLGLFPNASEKFGISLWGNLPVFVLFEKATEVARFPDITSESKTFIPTVTKKLLCQYFDLDRRLIEYLSN